MTSQKLIRFATTKGGTPVVLKVETEKPTDLWETRSPEGNTYYTAKGGVKYIFSIPVNHLNEYFFSSKGFTAAYKDFLNDKTGAKDAARYV